MLRRFSRGALVAFACVVRAVPVVCVCVAPYACGGQATQASPGRDAGGAAPDGSSAGDAMGETGGPMASTPRPIAPLSTATVTSQRPTLHWALADGTDGARVDICRDRACESVVTTFTVSGTSGAPASALSAGVYFWRLHGVASGTVGSNTGPVWEFSVGARSAAVDTSWGGGPDVNGDGYADVVVGSGYGESGGFVYVYLGGPAGVAATPTMTIDDPNGMVGQFADTVAGAGDVNGDGYADVVVSASSENEVGEALVYFGGPGGLSPTPSASVAPPTPPDGVIGVASAIDVNGDGYADLIVAGACGMGCSGAAYLYLGGAAGLSTTPSVSLTGSTDPDAAYVWFAIASSGDVNGDGYADVVVGSGASHTSDVGDGRLDVYEGGPNGLSATPTTTIVSPSATEIFGQQVAGAGDINGDGFGDILVGSNPGLDGVPIVFVYLGAASGASDTAVETISNPPNANNDLGTALAGVGDVNGDGFADVLVAAPSDVVDVFLGASSGLPATASLSLPRPSPAELFGGPIAGAGDVNGDGLADVLVVSGTRDGGGETMGFVYVYLGATDGPGTTPAITLLPPAGDNGWGFGEAVASYRDAPAREVR